MERDQDILGKALAVNLMQELYRHVQLMDCPDAPGRQTRPGGNPDCVFEDGSGKLHAVESTRLLPSQLKAVEDFLQNNVAQSTSDLPGTYFLDVVLSAPTEKLPEDEKTLKRIADKIACIAPTLDKAGGAIVIWPNYSLIKIGDAGSSLHVWPLYPKNFSTALPDPLKRDLEKQFEKAVREAGGYPDSEPCKFDGYDNHNRILGIDIGPSPLWWLGDWELFKRWLESFNLDDLKLDEVVIGDFKVWVGGGQQVPVGHDYEHVSYRKWTRLWTRGEGLQAPRIVFLDSVET